MRTLVLHAGDHTACPYGIDLFPGPGFPVTGVRPLRGRLPRKLRDVVEHRTHTMVDVPLRAVPGVRNAELVLGLLEPVTALAAQLRRRDVPPYAGAPLVMISCWLVEWIRRADPDRRRALVRRFSAVDLILTLSRNQIDILVDAGFRADQVAAIPFGCAPELFTDDGTQRAVDVFAAWPSGRRSRRRVGPWSPSGSRMTGCGARCGTSSTITGSVRAAVRTDRRRPVSVYEASACCSCRDSTAVTSHAATLASATAVEPAARIAGTED